MMDNYLVNALASAMDFSYPSMKRGEEEVAAQEFILELQMHGYKIVKESE